MTTTGRPQDITGLPKDHHSTATWDQKHSRTVTVTLHFGDPHRKTTKNVYWLLAHGLAYPLPPYRRNIICDWPLVHKSSVNSLGFCVDVGCEASRLLLWFMCYAAHIQNVKWSVRRLEALHHRCFLLTASIGKKTLERCCLALAGVRRNILSDTPDGILW